MRYARRDRSAKHWGGSRGAIFRVNTTHSTSTHHCPRYCDYHNGTTLMSQLIPSTKYLDETHVHDNGRRRPIIDTAVPVSGKLTKEVSNKVHGHPRVGDNGCERVRSPPASPNSAWSPRSPAHERHTRRVTSAHLHRCASPKAGGSVGDMVVEPWRMRITWGTRCARRCRQGKQKGEITICCKL